MEQMQTWLTGNNIVLSKVTFQFVSDSDPFTAEIAGDLYEFF